MAKTITVQSISMVICKNGQKGEIKMTGQQVPKLVAGLVEHQTQFVSLSVEDGQWVIQNTAEAINLFLIAVQNRAKAVSQTAQVYPKRHFTLTLGAIEGKDLPDPEKVFAYLDPDFKMCGITFSGSMVLTEIDVDDLIHDGRFTDFLGSTATELEKHRLTGSQFLKLCSEHGGRLRGGGCANFFVLTKGDEPVREDLSNVSVADVFVNDDGELFATLRHVSYGSKWRGGGVRRAFSPQP